MAGQINKVSVHAQVEGNEVNVGFEWGNEGSLSVDAKAGAATNGVPPAGSLADSPVQHCPHTSAAAQYPPGNCLHDRSFPAISPAVTASVLLTGGQKRAQGLQHSYKGICT